MFCVNQDLESNQSEIPNEIRSWITSESELAFEVGARFDCERGDLSACFRYRIGTELVRDPDCGSKDKIGLVSNTTIMNVCSSLHLS